MKSKSILVRFSFRLSSAHVGYPLARHLLLRVGSGNIDQSEDFIAMIVQFFFNETKSKDEVSRFWLWDSHRENPVGDVEKRLPYLPQDRRSRSDPYLGIPPR